MKKLRIFISSPGDVVQERIIAKNTIAHLSDVYSQYVEIETIMWEDLPLEATGSFQAGIDYFLNEAPIDIAVFILWSRLGSKLGQSYLKEDGTPYESGTEYEFDIMYKLWEKNKSPRIVVYVKDADIQIGKGLSSSQIKSALEQQDKLNSFIEEKFRDRETGTNYAYMQFDKQQTFEERLNKHLSTLIKSHIGHDVKVREWNGNPYVGLKSFDVDESQIFCGRKGLTYDIIEKITDARMDGEEATLLVLGESGSGKSSLVKAGLIPYFKSLNNGECPYAEHIVCPSEFRGNVYNGLLDKLLVLFPGIENNPVWKELKKGIDGNFNFEYLSYAIRQCNTQEKPILFLDQFEELFSDNLIAEEDRLQALRLLYGLSLSKQVMMIISMRNDFYSKITTYADFGAIKNESIVVDIPNVSASDILEIIEEPARKANLKWEINNKGVSLSKQIAQEAGSVSNLPLLEFALSELYNKCSDTEYLTFKAYEEIGRLEGAVVKYANDFYQGLSNEEKQEFEKLLSSLVAIALDKKTRFVRKTASKESVIHNECSRTLITKLINAHLLVSGKDVQGNSSVSLVHEVLISSWPVISEWTKNQDQFLLQNDYYEKQARHWELGNRKKQNLIQERSSLLEAEYFMFKNESRLGNQTRKFLDTSLISDRKKGLVKYVAFTIAICLFGFCSIFLLMLGTSGDADLDEMIGLSELNWWDLFSLYIPLLSIAVYGVYLRMCPKYKYQTIAGSSILWLIFILFLIPGMIIDLSDPEVDKTWLIVSLIPFLLVACSVWIEYWRRHLWKKGRFVPYLTTDKYKTVMDIVVWVIVGVFVIFVFALHGVNLTEKNQKLTTATEKAEECFDVLNNIQNQLTWSDNKYLNKSRMEYLEALYADELQDTIPDKNEGKYALCLYNLYEPLKAIIYLYPNYYWDQRYLYIAACMRAGFYSSAESYMELCAQSNEYLDYHWITTANLIWDAEKIGRFDLAEAFYEITKNNREEQLQQPAIQINYGHILLMKGDYEGAWRSYEQAMKVFSKDYPLWEQKNARNAIANEVKKDMDIFRWLEVGNEDAIRTVRSKYNFDERDFLTSVADSTITKEVVSELEGGWVLSDSTAVVYFYSASPLCQYMVFATDQHGNVEEVNRMMTNVRFSDIDGHIYIEEFNPEQGSISASEVLKHTEDELHIRIIENGNPTDKETVRIYTKIRSETD